MSKVSLNDYQAMSNETAVYPGQGTLIGLMYVALGLGEAGEVQGKVKKILRDDFDEGDIEDISIIDVNHVVTPEKKTALIGELGDILWYLAQTATELDVDLEEIAVANLEKLNSRKDRGVLQGSGDNR